MADLVDKLTEHGIRPKSLAPGSHYMTCPKCSANRKPANRKKPCFTLTIDPDGTGAVWFCQNCEWKGNVAGGGSHQHETRAKEYKPARQPPPDITPHQKMLKFFEARAIGAEIIEHLGIYLTGHAFPQETERGRQPAICYPYRFRGRVVSNKYRSTKKAFAQDPGTLRVLYNADSLENTREAIFVEGENDVAAVLEAMGPDTACVSLPDGAPAHWKDEVDHSEKRYEAIQTCAELLAPIKRFTLATDGDQPGDNLAHQLALRFGFGRCFKVRWPQDAKDPDPNGVLRQYGAERLRALLEQAPGYPVEGLWNVAPNDLINWRQSPRLATFNVGLSAMDDLVRFRPGQVVVVTGWPGHGKTEWVLWVATELARNYGWHWCVCSPEHMKEELAELVAEKYIGEPSRTYGVDFFAMSDAQMAKAELWVGKHFSWLWQENEKQPVTLDWIFSQARIDHLRHGINGLLIDPYNQIEHERAKHDSEHGFVSHLMRRLKLFARSHNAVVFLLAHPQKLERARASGKRPVPTLHDVAGSSHFYNMCDIGMTVHRAEQKGAGVEIVVQKVKRKDQGRAGTIELLWDKHTGRYTSESEGG